MVTSSLSSTSLLTCTGSEFCWTIFKFRWVSPVTISDGNIRHTPARASPRLRQKVMKCTSPNRWVKWLTCVKICKDGQDVDHRLPPRPPLLQLRSKVFSKVRMEACQNRIQVWIVSTIFSAESESNQKPPHLCFTRNGTALACDLYDILSLCSTMNWPTIATTCQHAAFSKCAGSMIRLVLWGLQYQRLQPGTRLSLGSL